VACSPGISGGNIEGALGGLGRLGNGGRNGGSVKANDGNEGAGTSKGSGMVTKMIGITLTSSPSTDRSGL
jgi:hypothetical protein